MRRVAPPPSMLALQQDEGMEGRDPVPGDGLPVEVHQRRVRVIALADPVKRGEARECTVLAIHLELALYAVLGHSWSALLL